MTLRESLWYPSKPEPLWKRVALWPLALLSLGWRAGTAWRRRRRTRRAMRVAPRVVSVGGITVGGAGKTPVVIFLAGFAAARGARVLVLSRGYGRRTQRDCELAPGGEGARAEDVGDEPLLIARRCPNVHVWVGSDRARLASRAAGSLRPDLILLDDGFQHWQLARDEDLVVLEGRAGLGNQRLLPRGPLREDLDALERATWVWWRAPSPARAGTALVEPPLVAKPTVRAHQDPSRVVGGGAPDAPIGVLRGARLIAFAGLARPTGFFDSLSELGAELIGRRAFADHHAFSAAELDGLLRESERLGATLVTTEKDAVRLPAGFPARAVRLDVRVHEGMALVPRHLLGEPDTLA